MDNAMDPDGYDGYRLAGELFGRIKAAVKFGDLSLRMHGRVFAFQWSFNAKGQRYGNQWSIDSQMLTDGAFSVQFLADDIVERWKASHRKVAETTGGE